MYRTLVLLLFFFFPLSSLLAVGTACPVQTTQLCRSGRAHLKPFFALMYRTLWPIVVHLHLISRSSSCWPLLRQSGLFWTTSHFPHFSRVETQREVDSSRRAQRNLPVRSSRAPEKVRSVSLQPQGACLPGRRAFAVFPEVHWQPWLTPLLAALVGCLVSRTKNPKK